MLAHHTALTKQAEQAAGGESRSAGARLKRLLRRPSILRRSLERAADEAEPGATVNARKSRIPAAALMPAITITNAAVGR
jgi:hypothetical protein